jgi:RNA polymerase sigma-70 factor (ECF subfamily)
MGGDSSLAFPFSFSVAKAASFVTIPRSPVFELNHERTMPPSDESSIRACLDSHPEAFRHLVERHQMPLVRHLCACFGNAENAAEIAQEAFTRAYFLLPKLRKPESFFSWLVGIADRVAKEKFRDAKRFRTVDWAQVDPTELAEMPKEQGDDALAEAVALLPETYREVIRLRYYEHRSCVEISGELGIPLGTVTKRLSRAYALLRESPQLNESDGNSFHGKESPAAKNLAMKKEATS